MTTQEVLKECTVQGNVVKLPAYQLDRKLYQDVAKSLQLIGGKWQGGKVYGFVFPTDPTELLEQIAGGEKRNLKKEFQFFGTPSALADELVVLANVSEDHLILEPSAGQGAIVKAIHRVVPNTKVYCYELMDVNRTFLNKIEEVEIIGNDFLNPDGSNFMQEFWFDRIIANPPFSKNQDIDHVRMMYDRLMVGGRLVAITSTHWKNSDNKKETEFRNWLNSVSAVVKNVSAGTFKESGTNVPTVILVIDKKEDKLNSKDMKNKLSLGGSLKKFGKRGLEKSKELAKRGLEKGKEAVKEEKRKIAISVLKETKNRNIPARYKQAVVDSAKIVAEEYAKGGGIPMEYKISPYKQREGMADFIEPDYENSQRFIGTLDEAIAVGNVMIKNNPSFVEVAIIKLGKVDRKPSLKLNSKKVAVVTNKGVSMYCCGGQFAKGGNIGTFNYSIGGF